MATEWQFSHNSSIGSWAMGISTEAVENHGLLDVQIDMLVVSANFWKSDSPVDPYVPGSHIQFLSVLKGT